MHRPKMTLEPTDRSSRNKGVSLANPDRFLPLVKVWPPTHDWRFVFEAVTTLSGGNNGSFGSLHLRATGNALASNFRRCFGSIPFCPVRFVSEISLPDAQHCPHAKPHSCYHHHCFITEFFLRCFCFSESAASFKREKSPWGVKTEWKEAI